MQKNGILNFQNDFTHQFSIPWFRSRSDSERSEVPYPLLETYRKLRGLVEGEYYFHLCFKLVFPTKRGHSHSVQLAGVTPLTSGITKVSQRLGEGVWHVALDRLRFPHLPGPNLTLASGAHSHFVSCVTEIVLFLWKPVDPVAFASLMKCVHTSQSTFSVQEMVYDMTATNQKLCLFLKQRISLPAEVQNPSTRSGYFPSLLQTPGSISNCTMSLSMLSR